MIVVKAKIEKLLVMPGKIRNPLGFAELVSGLALEFAVLTSCTSIVTMLVSAHI